MEIVIICAIGVGGATMLGAVVGFLFRGITHKCSDAVLSFAAGVSFAAAVLGLIIPSLEYGGKYSLIVTVIGIFSGAVCVNLLDRAVPFAHKFVGLGSAEGIDGRGRKILVFVMAIAIHNLPEGIAAGVGFGSEDISAGILIALGIAIQNVPEGMVIIAPMLSVGISPGRTLVCALATGLVEVIGTFIGYYAVTVAEAVLPFSLAFAGGTMLYVVSDDMIPETHSHGNEHAATYALLLGFCLMLAFSVLL
ncbi:MAG: ZIP family metal transporter [Clostridia bacterium]|nr:ZIP family metal transporter [Clostridia bacterium]